MNRSRLFCSFPMTCEYGSWEGNTSKKPDVNRSHEPIGIPLNRPPGTFSPTGGEGWDEGERFMESEHLQKLDVSWGYEPGRRPQSGTGFQPVSLEQARCLC